MRYLLVAPFFGTFGWIAGEAARESFGEIAAALVFGLVVSLMVAGFDLRRRLDGQQKAVGRRPEGREGLALEQEAACGTACQLSADGRVGRDETEE